MIIATKTAVQRATRNRQRLAQAQVVLRADGSDDALEAARLMQGTINKLSVAIDRYYQSGGTYGRSPERS
ncbi:hypothetical protein PBI_THONKO_103 [Mycobacterium phage Thonko]|uniref:Uncharacterized protein n=1 Tax=Mycobacterium phage Thonko TaxID=2282910 RepID=A0A346FCE8_9CAUD|nr:hypothetical protein I5G57_gp103 [Mycobacterium phage Thonko]AXN53373.1 hypothetical protein PBI_THONKO_103 [Mycobacterium phage Thonko]